MKRIIATLLLLCIMATLCSCTKDQPHTSDSPSLRHEGTTAYYTAGESTCTMDLEFQQTVAANSKVSLLLEEEEILTFTTEADLSRLQISHPRLEKNKTYTLIVNGKIQKHGSRPLPIVPPRPGDIPDPTQPTVPVEPMGQIATVAPSVTDETRGNEEPPVFENPPIVSIVDDIPSLTPIDGSGILPSESFVPGQSEQHNDLIIRPAPQIRGTGFTLTGAVTEFASVTDA